MFSFGKSYSPCLIFNNPFNQSIYKSITKMYALKDAGKDARAPTTDVGRDVRTPTMKRRYDEKIQLIGVHTFRFFRV